MTPDSPERANVGEVARQIVINLCGSMGPLESDGFKAHVREIETALLKAREEGRAETEKIYNSLFISRDRPITAQTDIRMLELALVRAREEGRAEAMEQCADEAEATGIGYGGNHCEHCNDGSIASHNIAFRIRKMKASLSENQAKGKGDA